MTVKLGKTAATIDHRDLVYGTYLNANTRPPASVLHDKLLPANVGMLANDQYGDCVWAGAAHETMLWNLEADRTVNFTPAAVLSDYAAVTGFDPKTGAHDDGTNTRDAAKYRLKTGIIDAAGTRHKIGGFVAVEFAHFKAAVWQLGVVGLGIQFPETAMDQFNAGKPWTVVSGAQIEGGHYIPIVGYDAHWFYVITWGKVIKVTPSFIAKYADEAFAYISTDELNGGKTIDGFNLAQLTTDLHALAA